MGNVLGINCNFNTPCDHLIGVCFPHEGAPRRKTINDLQNDLGRLKATRDDITRTIRESLNTRPFELETQWLQQVDTLEGKVETLIADYFRLHPRTDNTQEVANNISAPIVESSERRPPEQVIHNQQAANNSVDIVKSSERRPPEQVLPNQQAATNSVDTVESSERRPPEQVIQNSKCFCGYSPKCIKSYCLWRKIQLMDLKVLDLLNQKPVLTVERPRIAPAQLVPTEPTTGLDLMLNKVWSHVQDESVRLIGLYGMGGVGKTTLLKAINNKLCSPSQNYDLLLWIVVSKSVNIIDIQNLIGEKIGLCGDAWKLKSRDDKAMDIYNVLCGKKYILLLDDIWEWFDLTKIGIPVPNNDDHSKVIFTTRSLQVCGQMGGIRIKVQCLKGEEAWNLFKEKVGETTLNAHHDIPGLAKDVMRECNGLPLALIVIGRAMNLKTAVQDWEHAIHVLKRYAAEISTMTDKVFTPLKFSYDNLTNKSIRSCFLYCSLYAEDEEILKSDLVDKWIYEDYLGRSDDLRNDRNEGYSYINTLVHASLLEECPGGKNVKMHDVIRDMALWIVGDAFYVEARADLTQIRDDVKWEHVEKMSFVSIRELNNGPTELIKLETILFRQTQLNSINSDFWKLVPYLKVLDLSGNGDITSLPEEFSELVFLQYLNLNNTLIEELPNGLVKLKYLNVINTGVRTIPKGVLLSMKELSVFKCGGGLLNNSLYFLGEKLVKEFEGLKCLEDVTIPAMFEVHISNLTSSRKLLNCITSLHLNGSYEKKWSNLGLDILFLKEMKHLQDLRIDSVKRIKEIEDRERRALETSMMNNMNGGFNTIRHLDIFYCDEVKNLSWLVFCLNIETIKVISCSEMQTLLGDETEYSLGNGVEPFAKLQSLCLSVMWSLESICVTSLSFPYLKSLYVDGVRKLKKLPFNSNSCDRGRGIVIKGRDHEWWNELEWEDEATCSTFSSCFIEDYLF